MLIVFTRRGLPSRLSRRRPILPLLLAMCAGLAGPSPASALPAAQSTPTFADVPFEHPYHDEIEALYQAGYTSGCSTSPLMYCPEQAMNRAESAVFVERGIHTASYDPPPPTSQVFADVPLDSWAAKWVNALWEDRYTTGCGTNPLVFCPWQGHSRAEGTVFYLRMLHGANYAPPEPHQQSFADVPLGTWYAAWVEAAHSVGLIPACQTSPERRFCPDEPLTRALAAYMMVQAKHLPVPGGAGIPYGPFHFGDKSTADYDDPLAPAFNSSFVYLGTRSVAQAQPLLQAARDHDFRVVASIGESYPCTYWDGRTFDTTRFLTDVNILLPTVASYYPETVVGVMLLNEPHDPQADCQPAVPAPVLYDAAKLIRAEFAKYGAGDIPLGYGSPASYFDAGLSASEKTDGTLSASFAQWHPGKGTIEAWAAREQAAAASMGHKLMYSVNARVATDQEMLDANAWQCQQADALVVWWYSWSDGDGPKTTVSLGDFQRVRAICDGD